MSNLTLLKADDVQKKWKNYNRVHGVYSLVFSVNEIYEFSRSDIIYINNVAGANGDVQLRYGIEALFKAMFIGNLALDGKSIRLLGRFVKVGQVVLFEPLTEQF
ncbi:hypothetical protein KNT87_gp171 [Erwinia phage Cronus]|uniref:Uncharacterized protein n=1 Tax=Erwinia phage Cronus TaxID=2163633 RepID=A0A2S1GLY0_9CAUD|nr:hypothetical protein KNT87_gp171 [Erwinia phage Cronus]AWD90398.1 hypothetical protein [Erwinia phage Cronus]